MPDKVVSKSFANVLRIAEVPFAEEVESLTLKSDTGDAVVNELRWFKRLTREECDGLIASLGNDGLWTDINYESLDVSNWEAANHLRRLVVLARQSRTEATVAACHKGLAGWLKCERVNPNWWWNEIGCPKELGVFALLFNDELTSEERSAVVKRLSGVQAARTGQNRVWLAECMLLRGLVEGNDEIVATAKEALLGEIAVRDGAEGIQSDWSFHQHGKTPQFGNYGIAYLSTLSRWAAVFADAGEGFAKERLHVLGSFLEKGLKRFVWQGRMDVGALGRQFGKGGMRVKGLAIELATHYLESAGWKSAQALECSDLSVYGQSAMAVYRTKRWMAAIKAETQSIRGVERINGDNLLGGHLADGALFSYVKGDEYEDVFPVWDWRRVPGITGYASTDAGGINAAGAMKARNQAEVFERGEGDRVRFLLQRDGLSAETTWTFSKDGVDVDVSHVIATSDREVITTVEQARAQPNARWWREDDRIVAINGGIRYELPGNAVVSIEPRTGDWHRVMESMPEKPVSTRIFQITIPHGVKPNEKSCFWKVCFPTRDDGLAKPLVSVVVPVYNVEQYVGECLDSLLAQTYKNIEVICVNDGSTDGSAKILEQYKARFGTRRKYTVVTQSNAGLSAARNAGMDVAKGKYIYFLDSDDLIVPDAIENLVNLAEINNLDQIIFNCKTFAEGNDPVLTADAEKKSRNYYVVPPEVNYRMLSGKELFCELMKSGHFYATQQMRFYKREVLVANGLRYPEGLVHEDNYMAPVSLFFAERATIVDEKWFLRRVRPNSIMTSGDNTQRRVISLDGVIRMLRDESRLWDECAQYAESLQKFILGLAKYAERMDKCLLSVILPCYNVASCVASCLESLLAALSHFGTKAELLCVDDGSLDETLKVLAAAEPKFKEAGIAYKIIRQDNGGAGKARNTGLAAAKGYYLYFCDADDWVEPDIFRDLVRTAEETQAELTVCGYWRVLEDEKKSKKAHGAIAALRKLAGSERNWICPDEISGLLFNRVIYSPWQKLLKASHVRRLGLRFQEIRRTNDMFFSCIAIAHATRIGIVDAPLYNYRRTASSVTKNDALAISFCDALAAVRDRLCQDKLFDKYREAFTTMALVSFEYNLNSIKDAEQLSRLYPQMREKIMALIPEHIEQNELITDKILKLYELVRKNQSPLPVAMFVRDEARAKRDQFLAERDEARKTRNEIQALVREL